MIRRLNSCISSLYSDRKIPERLFWTYHDLTRDAMTDPDKCLMTKIAINISRFRANNMIAADKTCAAVRHCDTLDKVTTRCGMRHGKRHTCHKCPLTMGCRVV